MKRLLLATLLIVFVLLGSSLDGSLFRTPVAYADGFLDFESGVEGQVISSSIPGLQFTTTAGYDWIYGDWRSGNYNGPYPNGLYYSNGDFFAWLGPNQGYGRIDFTESCATYLQVYVSSNSGLIAEAYYASGELAATASVPGNLNTGTMERLRVDAPPGDCFNYVILHDSGNYWLIDDLSTDASGVPATRPPVVFLPGLTGSRLDHYDVCEGETSDDAEEMWPAWERMLDPFDTHLTVLALNEAGTGSANPCDRVSVGRVTDTEFENGAIRVVGPIEFYAPLIDALKAKGYSVYTYGYDWRLDLEQIANDLDAFIDEVKGDSEQVNIVAHSLGGLLARQYVTSGVSRATKVEQVISLGTPYLGAPKALRVLRWGDYGEPGWLWGAIGLNASRVKELSQNSPSMYQILPTARYFDVSGDYYSFNGDFFDAAETRSVIVDDHNDGLLLQAESFHSPAMDDWSSTVLPVAYRIIVGTGEADTPGVLLEREVINWFGHSRTIWDMQGVNGDGTVPLPSAALQGNGHDYSGTAPIWYANGLDHKGLVTEPYILDFVSALLATPPGTATIPHAQASEASMPARVNAAPLYLGEEVTSRPERSPSAPQALPPIPPEMSHDPFAVNGAQFAAFGPAILHVYDELGNHTGSVEGGTFETGVPGSDYLALDNAVFVTVPAGPIYTIIVEAGIPDEVDLRLRDLEGVIGSLIQRTISYQDIALGEYAVASLTYNPADNAAGAPDVSIDRDGNGTVDDVVQPTGDTFGTSSGDSESPEITVSISGDKAPGGWYVGDVVVTITVTDNLSGLAKVEYSIDSGNTIENYSAPIVVDADTVRSLVIRATDKVGNEEWLLVDIGPEKLFLPSVTNG